MAQIFGNKAFPLIIGIFESFSGLFLTLGLFINYASVVLGIVMLGALYYKIVKWKVPFFAMDKTGWEFDLVLLACNIFLFLIGASSYTISSLF